MIALAGPGTRRPCTFVCSSILEHGLPRHLADDAANGCATPTKPRRHFARHHQRGRGAMGAWTPLAPTGRTAGEAAGAAPRDAANRSLPSRTAATRISPRQAGPI